MYLRKNSTSATAFCSTAKSQSYSLWHRPVEEATRGDLLASQIVVRWREEGTEYSSAVHALSGHAFSLKCSFSTTYVAFLCVCRGMCGTLFLHVPMCICVPCTFLNASVSALGTVMLEA